MDTRKKKGASITASNIANDQTIYARLNDGTNPAKDVSISVKDKIAPTVTVKITRTTSNSIIVVAEATDEQTGMEAMPTYTYYIKKKTDSNYPTEPSYTGAETYIFTELEQETEYTIKVITQDIGGNTGTGTQEGRTGEVPKGTVTGAIDYGTVNWSNGKASIPINTNEAGYYIEYQVGSISGTWTRGVSKGASVTASNIENNTMLYARLSDGTNAGTYTSILIKDSTAPTVTVNITGTTSDEITAQASATDGQTGMVTNPTYTFYIKETAQADSTYTQIQSGTSITCTKAGLKQNTSYTVKATTIDIGGNTGTGTKAGTTGEVTGGTVTGAITYGTVSWSAGKASTTITTNQTGYYIEYQVGSTSGTWTRATTKGASVTASSIANNQTVYARLSDGTNAGTYGSILVKDTTAPTVTASITNITSDSITAQAGATDSQTGMATSPTYTFYIKETAQADSTYTQIQSGTSTTCTKAGLKQNTKYTMKVTTTDIGGNTGTGTKEGTTGVVPSVMTWGTVNWSGGKASITISTSQTGYYIEYQVGSTSGTWTRATNKGASITASNIANNTTVYARLSDGTNAGTYGSLLVKDATAPTVTVNIPSTTSSSITATASATDSQTGMATTPTYTFYIKETAQEDSTYTQIQSGTSTTCTKAGLKQNTSYTIKVTTQDIGGNIGTGTKAGITGEVPTGVTWGALSWSGGKASITISTSQTGYYIEYQVGSTSGTWTRATNKGASITASNIANNTTVYARLSDGTNAGTYGSILVKDTTAPTVTASITNITSDSITATASATDKQTGMATTPTYTFYIKETAQADSTYTQIQSGASTTCTKAGLKQNTSYTIKVTTQDIGGNIGTGTKAGITGEVPTGVTWGALSWSGGKASITISTSQTGYYIEYQVGSTSGTWTRATNKGASITVSSITNNQTVYARLSDGTNAGTYGSLLVKDATAPTVTVNIPSTTSSSITATASATDTQTGMATTPTYTFYIKETAQADSTYTQIQSGASTTCTKAGLKQNTSYTIKVTTQDIGGNIGTGTKAGLTGEVPTGVTWGALSWNSKKASIIISTSKTGYYIEYQVGSTTGTWTRGTGKGTSVTASNISHNQTVYARLSDGTNAGTYASMLVKDTTAPTVNVSMSSSTVDSLTVTVVATDSQAGMATSPTYTYYIKKATESSYPASPSYTGANANYTFTGLVYGTSYTVKVTTQDLAGNTGTGTNSMEVSLQETNASYFTWTTTSSAATITGLSTTGKSKYDSGQLTDIVIPKKYNNLTVTTVESDTFYGCEKITRVIIPDTVTTVKYYAFRNCTGISYLSIPISLDIITEVSNSALSAFQGCAGITNIVFTKGTGTGITYSGTVSDNYYGYTPWYYSRANSITVTFQEGITSIGAYMFYANTGISSVNLPSTLTTIGDSAFYGCTGITNMILPTGITTIGSSAFSGCTGMRSINLPDTITSIGGSAFSGCSSLTSEIKIPKGIATIESYAFQSCTKITRVIIPDTVTTLATYAFSGCTGISYLSIPISLSVTYTNSAGTICPAFSGCTGITNIVYTKGTGTGITYTRNTNAANSSGVTPWYYSRANSITVTFQKGIISIGAYMFYGNTSFARVNYTGTAAEWNAITKGANNTALTSATINYNYSL